MKYLKYVLPCALFILLSNSCKKDNSDPVTPPTGGPSAADVAKADSFKVFIKGKDFQIRDYYSDKPIDYNDTDNVVKSETALFSYVSLWIKDDTNVVDIDAGKVTVIQNADKIPGNTAATITGDFIVGADSTGAYLKFLDYQYRPLKYTLVEFTQDQFIISANWTGGAKVFTKFGLLAQ